MVRARSLLRPSSRCEQRRHARVAAGRVRCRHGGFRAAASRFICRHDRSGCAWRGGRSRCTWRGSRGQRRAVQRDRRRVPVRRRPARVADAGCSCLVSSGLRRRARGAGRDGRFRGGRARSLRRSGVCSVAGAVEPRRAGCCRMPAQRRAARLTAVLSAVRQRDGAAGRRRGKLHAVRPASGPAVASAALSSGNAALPASGSTARRSGGRRDHALPGARPCASAVCVAHVADSARTSHRGALLTPASSAAPLLRPGSPTT